MRNCLEFSLKSSYTLALTSPKPTSISLKCEEGSSSTTPRAQRASFLVNYPRDSSAHWRLDTIPHNLNPTPRSCTGRCTLPKVNIFRKVHERALNSLWGRDGARSRATQERESHGFHRKNRSAHLTLCFGAFVSNWHFNFKAVHKTPFDYLAQYRFYITLKVTDSIHFRSHYKTD